VIWVRSSFRVSGLCWPLLGSASTSFVVAADERGRAKLPTSHTGSASRHRQSYGSTPSPFYLSTSHNLAATTQHAISQSHCCHWPFAAAITGSLVLSLDVGWVRVSGIWASFSHQPPSTPSSSPSLFLAYKG